MRNATRRLVLMPLALAACLVAAPELHAAPQDGTPPAAADAEAKKSRETLLASYDRGLDFLLTAQKEGVWDAYPGKPSPELTAIAVGCFLARPDGCREKDRAVAAKATDYLLGRVDADGLVKDARTQNYAVSAVIMALVASGRADAKPAIDRCVARIKSFQILDKKDAANFGGISYGPASSRADVSNTQYALASLRAAGVPPDDPVFKNAVEFLMRCQNRKENETAGEAPLTDADGKPVARGNDGGAVYRPGAGGAGYDARPDGTRTPRSYGSMTYSLLGCYHLAGLSPADGRVKAAVEWISHNFTLDHNPGMPEASKLEGLYYMYDAMARALSGVGVQTVEKDGAKIDWRKALVEHIAKQQLPDGSWLNQADAKFMENHPIVATSLALLSLSASARR